MTIVSMISQEVIANIMNAINDAINDLVYTKQIYQTGLAKNSSLLIGTIKF